MMLCDLHCPRVSLINTPVSYTQLPSPLPCMLQGEGVGTSGEGQNKYGVSLEMGKNYIQLAISKYLINDIKVVIEYNI